MDPVVVVGGGVVGTAVARHLSRRDAPVVLFEREELGSGTSGDSIAVFAWQQTRPNRTEHELRERSWAEYERLVDGADIGFEQTGTLHVANSDATLETLRTAARDLRALGVSAALPDAADLASHGIDPGSATGALYTPDDGYLDPSEIGQHYAREARAAGATIETGVEVTDVVVDDGAVAAVDTSDGRTPASAVVNAAGPWAPFVNEMAGVSLPLRHNFGPILALQSDERVSVPFVEFEDGYYVRPEGDSQLFAGRFGARYEDAAVVDPDHARPIDHEFYLAVEERLSERLASPRAFDLVNEWVGVRTITPDGRPFVGETDVAGFFVACGLSGLGVTRAPAVAQVLARSLVGDPVDPRIESHLAPDRRVE
jgi:sarcosine oxidase subunit beta